MLVAMFKVLLNCNSCCCRFIQPLVHDGPIEGAAPGLDTAAGTVDDMDDEVRGLIPCPYHTNSGCLWSAQTQKMDDEVRGRLYGDITLQRYT
jgi:hypothetical protein